MSALLENTLLQAGPVPMAQDASMVARADGAPLREECESRILMLQQCICELLIKNQQLRMQLAERSRSLSRGGHGSEAYCGSNASSTGFAGERVAETSSTLPI